MSTDFHLIARFKVAADKADTAIQAVQQCVGPSRAESGCISYVPHQDLADPGQFFFIEHWRSQEDLDRHMQTPHFQTLAAALEPLLVEPLAIVSRLKPLD